MEKTTPIIFPSFRKSTIPIPISVQCSQVYTDLNSYDSSKKCLTVSSSH